MHSTTSNTERITIPTDGDGIYLVGTTLHFQYTGAGTYDGSYEVQIIIGDGTIIACDGGVQAGYGAISDDWYVSMSTLWNISSTGYFRVRVYAENAVTIKYTASKSPEFWAIFQRRPL